MSWSPPQRPDDLDKLDLEVSGVYPNAAIGMRHFFINQENYLISLGAGNTAWRPGVNIAYCRNHPAPKAECSCGLYMYYFATPATDALTAICACKGDILLHADGFRAQEAQIIALIAPSIAKKSLLANIEKAALIYGVDVIGEKEANEWMKARGSTPKAPLPVPGDQKRYRDKPDGVFKKIWSALKRYP